MLCVVCSVEKYPLASFISWKERERESERLLYTYEDPSLTIPSNFECLHAVPRTIKDSYSGEDEREGLCFFSLIRLSSYVCYNMK